MVAHPLQTAVETAVAEQKKLLDQIKQLEQDLKASTEREAIQRGRIQTLEDQLNQTKVQSEFNLRCAIEIATQLHNVGIFVSDALHTAKTAVGKGNGQTRQIDQAYDAVEKALSHESLQPESDERQLPNNQVHGRP